MTTYIHGHGGFLGSHLERLIGHDEERADTLVNCAARVGGIAVNEAEPADMLTSNICAAIGAFELAIKKKIRTLINFGSTCAYSPECRVPFKPEDYLKGEVEVTNGGYAEAKRMIYRMGRYYEQQYGIRSLYLVMPNLYGPGDRFDHTSHVIPAMIQKMVVAKADGTPELTFRGTGTAEREFLFVEDAARLVGRVLEEKSSFDWQRLPIHLTSGETILIKDLAALIATLTGYAGEIRWDRTQSDGQKKRLLEKGLQLEPGTSLEEGLSRTIASVGIDKTGVGV